jgi:hypothetical protein
MNIKEANEKFEQWRKDQIASLIRTRHLEAAKAFEQLGSIHWMAWQCAWQASRESLVIELPPRLDAKPYACYGGGWNDMRGEAVDAIEATGLKVKS